MKKWLSLNKNKIYRKFKTTLNFSLIKKSKLTKFFRIFLEKYYLKTRFRVLRRLRGRKKLSFFSKWKGRKRVRRFGKKKFKRRKFKKKRWKLWKRLKVSKLRKRKRKRRKRLNKFVRKNNKIKYFYKVWKNSFFNAFKNKYFPVSNYFSLKKKKMRLNRKKYKYKLRRYKIYKKATLVYCKILGRRIMKEKYVSIQATVDWLEKNRSFSIYMPEAKKKKKRKKKKSNWWKLRMMNRRVALHYGFTSLKKFRYFFNIYETGMDFKLKSACRLELMLNMVILSLSIVDSVMLSNNFVRILGVNINGNKVSYPYRNLLKGDMISFDQRNFLKIFKVIKNRFKKDKLYVLNKFKLHRIKKQKIAFLKFKREQKYNYESNKRNTMWYVRAIKRFPARIEKAKIILKRLEDINEIITQDDIDFFYDIKRTVKKFFKRWIIDGRAALKNIKIIKNIPKYIEANFKILHFIIWDYPNNKQIIKLFKKKFSLHSWNFSTQIENN